MNQKPVICDYCSEEILSVETLSLCKSRGINLSKYHTTCYANAAKENPIKLSKPINYSNSVLSLSVLSLCIIAFMIFSDEKRLVFAGILLFSIVFIDIPYYMTWKNVVKPLHERSNEKA